MSVNFIEDKSQGNLRQAEGVVIATTKNGTSIDLTVTPVSVLMSVDNNGDGYLLTISLVETTNQYSQFPTSTS